MKANVSRPRPLVEAQMISLADIAFLIIFFFMMTSSFMKDKVEVKVPELPGKTGMTESGNSVAVDVNHAIHLNGEKMANADALEGNLKTLLQGKKEPKQLEVRLRCDRSVTYKDYQPVYNAISNAGGIIAIVHDVRKR